MRREPRNPELEAQISIVISFISTDEMSMTRSDTIGMVTSLFIHALLGLLFLLIKTEPQVSERIGFIQVDFGEYSEGRPVQRAEDNLPEREQPTPEPEPEIEEPPAPADPEVSKPVDLPDAPEVVNEEPPISSPETEIEAIQPEDPEEEDEIEQEEEVTPQPVKPLGSGSVDGNAGAEEGAQGDAADETKTAPFQIEGLNRTPVRVVRPLYSEKVNVTIRVRVTVNPRGEIIHQIPLLKGNPNLEQSVLKALQGWRFNPLPPNVPQENQTGTITFRFRLE